MKPFQLLKYSLEKYEAQCCRDICDMAPDDPSIVLEIMDTFLLLVDGNPAYPLPETLLIMEHVKTYMGRDYYSPPFHLVYEENKYEH